MFQIMTDTSANLPSELTRKKGITVIPFPYFVNGARHTCLDTEGFDSETFYGAMREGAEVSTSQINPQNYIDVMRPVLEQGEDILFVGMSSGISGAYYSAELAAAELQADFTDRKIRLVDTIGASLGEGLLVLRAEAEKVLGRSLDDIYEKLLDLRHRMCNIFTVDDLKYLRKGGRLSNLSFIVGTILQIKPLLKGDESGKIVAFAKLRGRKKALEELAKRYDEYVVNPEEQMIGIAHADCPEDADRLAELLRRNHPPREILTVGYEPVTGSHVGPGTLALFFLAREGCRGM
ncbi:MAG: DegV family protein [Oscillospiraceae bacterium]|nr:DegV family protein [Oscillospiraceae bacterium]